MDRGEIAVIADIAVIASSEDPLPQRTRRATEKLDTSLPARPLCSFVSSVVRRPMTAMSAITRDHGDPLLCIFPLTLRPTYLNILGVRRFDHYGLEPQRNWAMD
jgi:hypothetical protein